MTTQFLNRSKQLVETCPQERIRNICIIAHVDHGKTSLSDFLLASNRHISLRQIESGQKSGEAVRFLDSRLDEIDRQITIKSSCISLSYERPQTNAPTETFLVNLIDSPGHVDFASEVSAAARLTDGGILVVDAVEGVRAQTCSVIKQAWENRIVPVLFINKIDKLAELVEDCSEAYNRIRQIVENVNLLFHDLLEAEKEALALPTIPDADLMRYQFDPVRGNVLFGSALHGWAFDLHSWTDKLVKPKLEKVFNRTLPDIYQYMFGEHALPIGRGITDFKPVTVSAEHPTPMFVKFVIEQIWALYDSDSGSAQVKLCEMFPVTRSVFESVIQHVPSPSKAVVDRAKLLLEDASEAPAFTSGDQTTVFIVKHHPADLVIGCLLGDRVDEIRKLNGFVGISRVFSGQVEQGQTLYVAHTGEAAKVKNINLLMGTSMVPVERAVTGCVVALEFGDELTASGGVTLSSKPDSPALISPYQGAQAIVRVTAEVKRSQEESRLDEGLKLLARSDPAVLVTRHPQTGERIIGCCGDEHLPRCIQDLERLFAVVVNIVISQPIVEVRESIAHDFNDDVDGEIDALPAWLGEYTQLVDRKNPNRTATCASPDGTCKLTVTALALPKKALEWMSKWNHSLRTLFHERQVPGHLWTQLSTKTYDACIESVREVMASFNVPDFQDMHVKSEALNVICSKEPLTDALKFGFQQVCLSGPLAEEPIRGVNWVVQSIDTISEEHPSSASYAVALACKSAMLAGPVRIAEPMLSLELQTEHVKAAQTVLAQRRADIFHSDLVEGSYSEYLIRANIPASDAFKAGEKSKLTFSDELRGATHGKVVWRLSFSHWQVLDDSCPIGTTGVAHKLVCGVRKRKGLSVGEKVVTDPDKQRTLTKMK